MTYKEFIDDILKKRGRFNCYEDYHERHHIIPKCMGGTDDEKNLVDLFAKEHFMAHKMLARENYDNAKLVYAWWCMCSLPGSSRKRDEVTAEEYEKARKAYCEKFSGGKNPSSQKIVRLRDSRIYGTVKECYIDNNMSNFTLYERLKIRREFVRYEEWLSMSDEKIERLISIDWSSIEHKNRSDAAKKAGNGGSVYCAPETRAKIGLANKGKNGRSIYCPELDESFNLIIEASKKYNISKVSISYCLCGKQKHAGKHPVTGEPLSWVDLENKNC